MLGGEDQKDIEQEERLGRRDEDAVKIENICCWKYLFVDTHCSKILTFLHYDSM